MESEKKEEEEKNPEVVEPEAKDPLEEHQNVSFRQTFHSGR